MSGLSLVPHNVHDVQVGGQRMLFHIPATGIFEMDEVSGAVFDLFKTHDSVTPDLLRGSLEERFGPEELTDAGKGPEDGIPDGGRQFRAAAAPSQRQNPRQSGVLRRQAVQGSLSS